MDFREVTFAGRITATILSVAVGIMLPITTLVFIIAMATDGWSRAEILGISGAYVTCGLWRRCDYILGSTYCRSLVGTEGVSGWFLAAQTFAVLALFGCALATVTASAYLVLPRFQRDQRVALLLSSLLYIIAFMSSLSCVAFTIGDRDDLGKQVTDGLVLTYALTYSFGMAVFCAIMTAALGVFMSIEICKSRNMIPA